MGGGKFGMTGLFLQANSEISSSFAARQDRYADRLTILRLRPTVVKIAFCFCRLQPFSGSRQTRRAVPLQDSITLATYSCVQVTCTILQSDWYPPKS